MRARFVELAPEGFEEAEVAAGIELAGYGDAAARVLEAFPAAAVTEVEAGWEDRWREFHHAVTIGPLWIGPPWEAAPAGVQTVVIDPGRAFGTGAHPTTRLCLELLLALAPAALLDVGCGSGVLSIAAAKLGFRPVTAIDFDSHAVAAAGANAAVNGVEITCAVVDALVDPLPQAGVGVANIALDAVRLIAPRLEVTQLVTSGYLVRDEPGLRGYRHLERRELAGWAADLYVAA